MSQSKAFVAAKGHQVQLDGAYNPKEVEKSWYKWWQNMGYFTPECCDKLRASKNNNNNDKPFVIVIPPPNVTGSLHLGHTLTTAIQDTIIRWHRMKGDITLWLPGTDHAGIATQVVVEKKMMNERKITRHDLGREQFVQEVWKWKEEYGNRIVEQLKRTGSSVDWSREVFTMDPKLSRAVTEAFVRLFESGKIYRATRMVNWCCKLKTAISDIEVEYDDIPKATKIDIPGHKHKCEFGTLTSFAYKVEGSDEEIVVATTRPETMLGDTAVAIHPEDPRYKHLHGKFVIHPFNGRRIPIVCDPVLVKMEFGTGAVKVTPAHDPNDFECGKRNKLPMINIFNDDGTINENGAPYSGMMRYEARFHVVQDLEKKGLFRGKADHTYRLGRCSRTGDIIEPMIRPQWFCDCKGMAAKACDAVRTGELKILPEMHQDTWFRWLENIHDWCISRQLWWGHRIPAYLPQVEGQAPLDSNVTDNWIVARSPDEAMEKAAAKYKVDKSKISLNQDEDVLDTWFSSGLFPFSSFGWPDNTSDMARFYPGSLLETGHDILFFWVARMVMMGLELTGKLPFTEVYLHAMVRDKFGRKMSKTLGNVIDPIDVIEGISLEGLHARLLTGNLDPKEVDKAKAGQKEQFPKGIPECGTDALRFALLAYTTQGRDINLDILRVVGYRNFCNKLWNAVKFTLMNLKDFQPPEGLPTGPLGFAEKWILSRLNNAIKLSNEGFATYNFATATTACFNFWLYELCDVFLELMKPIMTSDNQQRKKSAQHVLYTCVEQGLRLLHPMMPFVTEELWQHLPGRENLPEDRCSIMVQSYPVHIPEWTDAEAEKHMELMMEVIHKFRSLKASFGLTNSNKPASFIACRTKEVESILATKTSEICVLSWLSTADIVPFDAPAAAGCVVEVVNPDITILLNIKGEINIDAELKKLQGRRDNLEKAINTMKTKMNSPAYSKVPADVKEQNSTKLAEQELELDGVLKAMDRLNAMK